MVYKIKTNKREILLSEDERFLSVVEEKEDETHAQIRETLSEYFEALIKRKEFTFELNNKSISLYYKNITGSTRFDVSEPKLICSFNYSCYVSLVDCKEKLDKIRFIKHITNHMLWRLIERNQDANIIKYNK